MVTAILLILIALAALSLTLHVTVLLVKLALWVLVVCFAVSGVLAALGAFTRKQ